MGAPRCCGVHPRRANGVLPVRKRLAIVGVGNPLAGDDGAGVSVVRRLREKWGDDGRLLLHVLEGDIFGIGDLLGTVDRVIFVDAVFGDPPGELRRLGSQIEPMALSLHHGNIGSVMQMLKSVGVADPFPEWEIRGITVASPLWWGEGLSKPVTRAVGTLAEELDQEIREVLGVA